MTGNQITVAVVVCAYTTERWADIVAAISSVQSQQPPADEIVLVIDHNDELLAQATKHFDSKVDVAANRFSRGLSGARNTGIEVSSSAVIAFLDDDAEADPGWISAIRAGFANEEIVGMGGKVNAKWLTKRPSWWPQEFDWVVGCSYIGLPSHKDFIRNPIGANMAVRRSAFDVVGGFSPAIGRVGKHPVGCEETELFIRISQHNASAKVLFDPSASVQHKVPGARATFGYFRARCFAEGLSKAVVARLVGSQDALSSERSYTTKVLPAGVARGLRTGLRGKKSGFGQAGAIVAGLIITSIGYLRGRIDKGAGLRLPQDVAK